MIRISVCSSCLPCTCDLLAVCITSIINQRTWVLAFNGRLILPLEQAVTHIDKVTLGTSCCFTDSDCCLSFIIVCVALYVFGIIFSNIPWYWLFSGSLSFKDGFALISIYCFTICTSAWLQFISFIIKLIREKFL